MYTYEQVQLLDGGFMEGVIRRIPGNAIIPFDPANTDYQEYLKWLAEGNTPESADMPPTEEQQ